MDINSDGLEAGVFHAFHRILALASIPCYGMVRAAKNRQNDEGTRRGIVTEVLNRLNHVDVGVISERWDEAADYVGVNGQLI